MVDTLTQVVQQVTQHPETFASLGLSTAGISGLIGKIVWDWYKKPHHCVYHESLAKDVADTKSDVAIIKNDIGWLLMDYKKRNGVN